MAPCSNGWGFLLAQTNGDAKLLDAAAKASRPAIPSWTRHLSERPSFSVRCSSSMAGACPLSALPRSTHPFLRCHCRGLAHRSGGAGDRRAPARYGRARAIALAMLIGAAIGVYHAGIEWKWWQGPQACAGGVAPLGNLLRALESTPIVPCDEAATGASLRPPFISAAFRQQSSRTNGAEADRDCWRVDSSLTCPLGGGAPAAGDEWRIFFPGSSRRG